MYRIVRAAAILACLFMLPLFTGCKQETIALNVNEVAPDPGAYTGTLTLTGVTAAFSRTDVSLFGLMDVKELQCTNANCHKVLLPIRTQGPLPKLGDELRLTGSFIKAGNGYLFVAERVEVLRNHKLGA